MKYGNLIHVEVSANGGGKVVHAYQDELKGLSSSEMKEFVKVSVEHLWYRINSNCRNVAVSV